MPQVSERFPEIDMMRGIAIILMVLFHMAYDLHQAYGIVWLNTNSFFFTQIGTLAALIFFTIFGVSAIPAARKYNKAFPMKCLQKGIILLCFAAIITIISLVLPLLDPVWFGVLHFLGISSFFLPLMVRLPITLLLFGGFVALTIGFFLHRLFLETPWLIPLGIRPEHFASSDYYPLLPWLFAVFFGVLLGKILYSTGSPPAVSRYPIWIRWVSLLGRHSLLIYLIHQPVIYGALLIIGL